MTLSSAFTILPLCAALALTAAAPAFADNPPKSKDDPSRRVCKVVTPTGSRFEKRVCKTADEWQRDEDFAQTRINESRLPPPADPTVVRPQ
jgi:hypothetical protein